MSKGRRSQRPVPRSVPEPGFSHTHSPPNPSYTLGTLCCWLRSEDPEAQARPWSRPGLENTPVPSSDELIRAVPLSVTRSDVCPLPRRLKPKALNHP